MAKATLTKAPREALGELLRLGHLKLRRRGWWGHPHSSGEFSSRTVHRLVDMGFAEFVDQGGRLVPRRDL